MYEIYYRPEEAIGNIYIYRANDSERKPVSANVKLSASAADFLEFSLPYDHPAIPYLVPMIGIVEVEESGQTVFRGRITKINTDFDKTKTYEVETQFNGLNDTIIEPFEYPSEEIPEQSENTVENLLMWFIDVHNEQANGAEQLNIGEVTVTDPNNYIARSSSDYEDTMTTIKNKLTDTVLGGYLQVRYGETGNIVDYLSEMPVIEGQKIEYGVNLLDLKETVDCTDVYTEILPIGANGLTIASIPDGMQDQDIIKSGLVMYSLSAVETYGKIKKTVLFDDVTTAQALKTKAIAELKNVGIQAKRSIEVQAIDMHTVNASIPRIMPGRKVQVKSEPHGIDANFSINEICIDILSPGKVTISVGMVEKTFTEQTKASERKTAERISQIS